MMKSCVTLFWQEEVYIPTDWLYYNPVVGNLESIFGSRAGPIVEHKLDEDHDTDLHPC